jgi:hypothetical protein
MRIRTLSIILLFDAVVIYFSIKAIMNIIYGAD